VFPKNVNDFKCLTELNTHYFSSKSPYNGKSRIGSWTFYEQCLNNTGLGNVQISYDASGVRDAQTVRVPSYGEGLVKSSYNFYSGRKSFFTVPLALFTVYVRGGGWLKSQNTVI